MKTSRLIRSNILKQSITADANCFELRELISACLACLFIISIGLLLVSHVAGVFLAKIMLVPYLLRSWYFLVPRSFLFFLILTLLIEFSYFTKSCILSHIVPIRGLTSSLTTVCLRKVKLFDQR